MNLILIWAVLISCIILLYVLLDGFDLGIGILFPWVRSTAHRDLMISTVAPVWDGNETWLVFGAAALYGAFPLAYGILLPTLYMPIMIMLLALIFRGVTFEFRFKANKSQWFWDLAFACGSTIAALMQGMILGTFVQGYGESLPISSHPYQWITPFSLFTGVAVVVGYALLGTNWLILKTVAELQQKMYQAARGLLGVVVAFLAAVCLWTPLLEPRILQRWLEYAPILFPLPLISLAIILYHFRCLSRGYERSPFLLSIALFVCAYIGFCISLWPYIVPHALTFWEAAAPQTSLKFTLVGVSILVPFLIAYTAYAYRVFRGKVTRVIQY